MNSSRKMKLTSKAKISLISLIIANTFSAFSSQPARGSLADEFKKQKNIIDEHTRYIAGNDMSCLWHMKKSLSIHSSNIPGLSQNVRGGALVVFRDRDIIPNLEYPREGVIVGHFYPKQETIFGNQPHIHCKFKNGILVGEKFEFHKKPISGTKRSYYDCQGEYTYNERKKKLSLFTKCISNDNKVIKYEIPNDKKPRAQYRSSLKLIEIVFGEKKKRMVGW